MTPLSYYTPKLGRHIRHLINNGFYARDLDDEDFAFLETIRERGTVSCESQFYARHSFDGELAFWVRPSPIENGIYRRTGPPTEKPVRPKKLPNEWHMRRAEREAERALMAAELAREKVIWDRKQESIRKERERRLREQRTADLEWEAAGARNRARYLERKSRDHTDLPARHYVPEWKRRENKQKMRPERLRKVLLYLGARRQRRLAAQEKERIAAARRIAAGINRKAAIATAEEMAKNLPTGQMACVTVGDQTATVAGSAPRPILEEWRNNEEFLQDSERIARQPDDLKTIVKRRIMCLITAQPRDWTVAELHKRFPWYTERLIAKCCHQLTEQGLVNIHD